MRLRLLLLWSLDLTGTGRLVQFGLLGLCYYYTNLRANGCRSLHTVCRFVVYRTTPQWLWRSRQLTLADVTGSSAGQKQWGYLIWWGRKGTQTVVAIYKDVAPRRQRTAAFFCISALCASAWNDEKGIHPWADYASWHLSLVSTLACTVEPWSVEVRFDVTNCLS